MNGDYPLPNRLYNPLGQNIIRRPNLTQGQTWPRQQLTDLAADPQYVLQQVLEQANDGAIC